MKRCSECGKPAMHPEDTSDRAMAELALTKMLDVLEYGARLERQYERVSETVTEQAQRINELTNLLMEALALIEQQQGTS